jgi:EF-P beta-lysylation protein EpmB
LLVPRRYADLMERGNSEDPLLRQVLPVGEELEERSGYSVDPVGDRVATQAPGLLQKYPGRALLIPTGACAVHCRYCFRRHFPFAGNSALAGRAAEALGQLRAATEVEEVVLSGGDPLMTGDRSLLQLIDGLQSIPHLRRLRVHSRVPVILPSRITPTLCEILAGNRLCTVIVIHANHPRELSADVRAGLRRLRRAGSTLLNQSVLLRGVNDSTPVLAELSKALFECGVLPYYLHMLDKVAGSGHFEVATCRAASLISSLRTLLPGYLVPRLAREEPGRPSKTILL